MSSAWRPHGVATASARRPRVGDLVAYDRRAWEVRHIADAEPTPEEAEELAGHRPAFAAEARPFSVTLRRVHGAPHPRENSAGDIGLRSRVGFHRGLPAYPNGRVPLCSCCNHPWPCLEADQQAQAERELARAERTLALPAGYCPACEECITSRQRSITFAGPNVRNPLAEGPTFHLRLKCRPGAADYEELWVSAEPGRPRSLLTLRCDSGTLIVHQDGTAECFGSAASDCPSVYARHRSQSACYLQSHGCGRGCTRAGHPGTRFAGRPDDPRAVTVVEERAR